MNDINLLPKRQGVDLKSDQAAVIIRRISIGVLALTVFTTMLLFILVIQSPLSKAKQEENTLLTKIESFKVQLSRNVIINERLASIEKIIQQRAHYEKYITTLLAKVPASLTITSLNIDKKTVQLAGNSSSLSATNTFLDDLVAIQKNKDLIQSVLLQSFAFDKESGKYFFTMNITFL
jgi:Tfp pilus assembly protein PilN